MSKDITEQLRRAAPTPRRELSATFTQQTLSKITNKKRRGFHWLVLKPAPVFIAAFVLLTLSTATYAAFNWQKVQVFFTGAETNKTFNRQELGFKVETCDALGANGKVRFGITPGADVTPDQLSAIIKARCEMAQAEQLYLSQPDWKGKIPPTGTKDYTPPLIDDISFTQTIAKIENLDGNKITTRVEWEDYNHTTNSSTQQNTIASNARAYADGKQIPIGNLKADDNVILVVHIVTKQKQGHEYETVTNEVVGLIKVDTAMIDPWLYGKAFEIKPCNNNPDTTCLDTPSPALSGFSFNAHEGEAGSFVRRTDIELEGKLNGPNTYQAQGRITSIDDQGFNLQGFESTRQFRVEIAAENRTRTLEVGDAIAVLYLQKPNENHSVIRDTDIVHSIIILSGAEKKF